jgi:hypothetical protein
MLRSLANSLFLMLSSSRLEDLGPWVLAACVAEVVHDELVARAQMAGALHPPSVCRIEISSWEPVKLSSVPLTSSPLSHHWGAPEP